jgi:hypothetical protein
MLADATSYGVSLTTDSTGRVVGGYTSSNGGLVSSVVWSAGTWSAPAPISQVATARAQPFIDATGGTTSHLVYQDSTYHYWYVAYSGAWNAPAVVGTTANPLYGPVPATIAARGADATVAFIDGQSPMTNDAAQSDLTGGAWQARADLAGPENYNVPPVIIPLSGGGPELMMIFVQSDSKIMFTVRTAGAWSTPVYINNCLTNDRVALAPLPGGGAIVAFRGTDTSTSTYLYWSVYAGGAWSAVQPFASPNVIVATSPAVTHGVGGTTAEIAFVQNDGHAYHARLSGSTWSAPVLVGGASLNGVAIAATP